MTLWIAIGLTGIAFLALLALVWLRGTRRPDTAAVERTAPPRWQLRQSRRAFLSSLAGVAALTALGGAGYVALTRPEGRSARIPGLAAPPSSGPFASAGEGSATPTAQPRRQPNVLVITVDTLRADRLGSYGFSQASTPNVDRLASEGARFTQAFCQLPQTNASHAALLTGLYPSTNGVRVHMVDKLRSGTQTMAKVFADGGYRTAGIYSWVSLDPQFCGLDQGFQSYQGYIVNRNGVFANSSLESLAAIYRQLKDKLPVTTTSDATLSQNYEETMDGRADVTTAAALSWLDGYTSSDPFFLWVHYYDPHYPYSPPAPYDHILGLNYSGTIDGSVQTVHKIQQGQVSPTDADVARLLELYQGEIAFADSQIGRLLDQLRTRGLLDDTIVALTADHGESFAEHGDWFHGLRLYETETHVPLIMRYPARVPAGLVVDAPTQLVDVLPTLADLAGIRVPQAVQGASLRPLLNAADDGTQRAAFTELAGGSVVSLVAGGWGMIQDLSSGQLQLYNVRDDSAELHDLSQAESTVVANLSARLRDVSKSAGVTS